MNDKASYYAIIPASVRYDKSITANAKLLYGEITALCNKEGYCWASNQYFADLYEVGPKTISEWVRQLKEGGYVTYVVSEHNSRQIYLTGVPEKTEGGYPKILTGGTRKNRQGVPENPDHNNTVNNTSNTTTKVCYGEFKNVRLTDDEKGKLVARYGRSATKTLVEELSTYMQSQGKRYKDHYATLLNWAKRKGTVEITNVPPPVTDDPNVLTPEQVEQNKLRLEAMRQTLAAKLRHRETR